MADDIEINKTMIITNPSAVKRFIGSETLIVCGSERGMTSVISYTLYELDYFLGETLQFKNYEDREFFWAFNNPEFVNTPLSRRQPLRDLIKKRNSQHRRWGFKLPGVVKYIPEMEPLFRNAIFVLCIRNPASTMHSIMTKNPNVSGGIKTAYAKATQWIEPLGYIIQNQKTPSIVIDMDKVRRDPDVFLKEFTDVLQLDGDTDDILKNLKSNRYTDSKPKEGVELVPPRKRAQT